MSNVVYSYKFNIPLGITEFLGYRSKDQIKFYTLYLESLRDDRLEVVIFKKLLRRLGSLGIIQFRKVSRILNILEEYEEENIPMTNGFRTVTYNDTTPVVSTNLVTKARRLGLQGANCQSSFHHRLIKLITYPAVLIDISRTVMLKLVTMGAMDQETFNELDHDFVNYQLEELI